VSGIWKACPPGKEQKHELQATAVRLVGEADPEVSQACELLFLGMKYNSNLRQTYPIQKKYHSPDFLRQIPHLRLRTPFQSLLARFRSECIYQLGQTFRSHPHGHFVQVQPPLITSSDCEGAGETFTVVPQATSSASDKDADHFFRSPKYLTVSSQLHLEAYAAELGNVWTLSPTFRAEKSDTPRHLSEFYMLEAEVNFANDVGTLTDLVEYLIRDLTRRVHDTPVGQEILSAKRSGESGSDSAESGEGLRKRWDALLSESVWPRVTYTRVIGMLEDAVANRGASFIFPPVWSDGLQLEHEKYIVDHLFGGVPVFVTDYPKKVKPFYMAPSEASFGSDSGKLTVACFDLLLPEISEVVGGSLREHRLPELIQNMREHGLIKKMPLNNPAEDATAENAAAEPKYPSLLPGEDLGHLQWYADLRRWGGAPHGGFGLGFDRLIGYLTGVGSLRDVVPFPRYFGRADC
jgi:asparaginyl-tRNA synthetase